ncbi:E3 ubiquitin-protein ligase Mdm2-like [Achroia grisella]|uniref:E3 ubiquitin-protein ligase Mdm2-like n=1 Tax=Achroia grisella TaxID=688607 RepID=UPI0027D2DF98|nr:E3 ubiquitin-protein ligase Mdm2-like [Achroia grisella]
MSTAVVTDNKYFRRTSTETVLSVQGKETDCAADTSDTETLADEDVEYEPVSDPENIKPAFDDTSEDSEEEIIVTNRITVTMRDDGEVEFADSEQTTSDQSDSEIDLLGYDKCARCHSSEHNTFYRYCDDCFKAKKTCFPPRPKARKRKKLIDTDSQRSQSQDSGVESQNSQKSQVGSSKRSGSSVESESDFSKPRSRSRCSSDSDGSSRKRKCTNDPDPSGSDSSNRKRSSNSHEHSDDESLAKKCKLEDDYDNSDSLARKCRSNTDRFVNEDSLQCLIKSVSEPSMSERSKDDDSKDLCIICYVRPKSGVFAHGRVAHICCCYKCAVKVWSTSKRCPVCNCKVSNVLRAVVM